MVTPPPPPFPSNLITYVGGGGGVVSRNVAITPKNCSNSKFYFKMGRLEQLSGRPPVSRAGGRAFETCVVCRIGTGLGYTSTKGPLM